MVTPKKKKDLNSVQLKAVSRLFAALAEPNRLALFQILRGGPHSVGELVEASGATQTNASRHLAVLHDCRLVKRERSGTSIIYEIADPMIFSLCDLVCGKIQSDAKNAAALF